MPRDPKANVRILGSTLSRLSLKKTFTINALSEMSGLWPGTVDTYLDIGEFIQQRWPLIKRTGSEESKLTEVEELPRLLQHRVEKRVLIIIYLRGATSLQTALGKDELNLLKDEEKILPQLIANGFIVESNGKYHLGTLGLYTIIDDIGEFFSGFEAKTVEKETTSPIVSRARALFGPHAAGDDEI